jgi:hypothetical protein
MRYSLASVRARRLVVFLVAGAALTPARPARAGIGLGTGLVTGAAVLLLGFTVGSTMVATAAGANGQTNTGWLLIESGFTVAPFAAHAALGQWSRGLAFAAPPTAALGGTAALFDDSPGTVLHGSLPEQRVMWGLFGLGLVSSIVGVIDVAFAAPKVGPVALAPAFGPGAEGLALGGEL